MITGVIISRVHGSVPHMDRAALHFALSGKNNEEKNEPCDAGRARNAAMTARVKRACAAAVREEMENVSNLALGTITAMLALSVSGLFLLLQHSNDRYSSLLVPVLLRRPLVRVSLVRPRSRAISLWGLRLVRTRRIASARNSSGYGGVCLDAFLMDTSPGGTLPPKCTGVH